MLKFSPAAPRLTIVGLNSHWRSKVRKMLTRACYAIGLLAAAGCSAEDIETKNFDYRELGAADVQLDCKLSALRDKISKLNNSGGTTQFDVALSFGQRKDGDGMLDVMKKRVLRSGFSADREAAIFVSGDKKTVTVARFNRKVDVNLMLKASAECEKSSGHLCTPVVYYDGGREYCLLFSKEELGH